MDDLFESKIYNVFSFGSLSYGDAVIDLNATENIISDVQDFGIIKFKDTPINRSKAITWVRVSDDKKIGFNGVIAIANCNLLTCVSWLQLKQQGFIDGKPMLIDGVPVIIRTPTISEWDKYVSSHPKPNWNHLGIYTICRDMKNSVCQVRGGEKLDSIHSFSTDKKDSCMGFRPVIAKV